MSPRPAPRQAPRAAAGTRPTEGATEVTLLVGPPAHGGHCVARPVDDPTGRVVFVRHALPGETVRARLTERGSKLWRAEATEVLTPSPDRTTPVWPEAGPGGVGGGELSHVALTAQRTWKRWVLADCLRRVGGEEVAQAVAALPEAQAAGGAVPVEAMPTEQAAQASGSERARSRAGTGTRTRVSLATAPDGSLGMHAFRSTEVLPVASLPLAVREIQELGLTERAAWRRAVRSLPPGTAVSAVAPSAGEPLVLVDGAVLTASGHPTQRRRVDEVVDASGLGLGELRYSLHAEGFWQVHRDAPSVLVDRVVRAALGEDPTAAGSAGMGPLTPARHVKVLELYSGAGLLTLPLALLGGEVRTIEGSATAVGDARRLLHDTPGTHLHAGRVTPRSVNAVGSGFRAGDGTADVVVLDPPRSGAGHDVVDAVTTLNPRRVVMVACDPASLARDLRRALGAGYRLASMSALDMFPHTHHFETVAVLTRE